MKLCRGCGWRGPSRYLVNFRHKLRCPQCGKPMNDGSYTQRPQLGESLGGGNYRVSPHRTSDG